MSVARFTVCVGLALLLIDMLVIACIFKRVF